MAKSLVIVESPTKAKTIGKYLGKEYVVMASLGHVKDLPKNDLAVDVERDFEPTYVVIEGKKKLIQELKQAAKKADDVYLAADPDREGEAICFHLQEELAGKKGGGGWSCESRPRLDDHPTEEKWRWEWTTEKPAMRIRDVKIETIEMTLFDGKPSI